MAIPTDMEEIERRIAELSEQLVEPPFIDQVPSLDTVIRSAGASANQAAEAFGRLGRAMSDVSYASGGVVQGSEAAGIRTYPGTGTLYLGGQLLGDVTEMSFAGVNTEIDTEILQEPKPKKKRGGRIIILK